MKKLPQKIILLAGVATLGVLLALSGNNKVVNAEDAKPSAPATYVGSKTCTTCHSDKAKDFNMSKHANAFKPLSAYALDKEYTAKIFDADQKTNVTITFDDKSTLGVMMNHYIVAKTPAGFKSPFYRVGALHELENGKWEIQPVSKVGTDGWGTSAYTCGNCHSPGADASAVTAGKTLPTEMGVSCESCHGPGSNHVAAADKAGSYAKVGADSCLACHPVEPAADSATKGFTAQNHYGTRGFYATKHYTSLQLNSCLTCHDPHKPNKNGQLLLADSAAAVCNTCHAEHAFDQAKIDATFWKNPVDARSHITADHSFYQVPLSSYIINETTGTMRLNNNAVNQLRGALPQLFK